MNTYGRFAVVLGTLSTMVVISCTENGVVGRYLDNGGAPPEFSSTEDAGHDAESGSTLYCPSNRCPPGHTTCPSSQFLCDVDLLTDMDNCGECGNKCPGDFLSPYSCAEGRCVLGCDPMLWLDCDGVPDNGCEASRGSNDNCGYCGNKCPADKPCIDRGTGAYACGCKPGELNCGGFASYLPCIDPSHDDKNCGACGNACPRDGDGTVEAPSHMYFGCFDGECGTLKCDGGFGNCDGVAENGCETNLLDDDNCGGCGQKCQDGMTCGLSGEFPMLPMCHCPEGTTLCKSGSISQGGSGVVNIGSCFDLSSDPSNCGGCGIRCAGGTVWPNASEACVYGRCEFSCSAGWGDCNGNRNDGCETKLTSDPKNCGGCGVVCDGIAGQACVDGRCMVEPCDELQDAGGPPR